MVNAKSFCYEEDDTRNEDISENEHSDDYSNEEINTQGETGVGEEEEAWREWRVSDKNFKQF